MPSYMADKSALTRVERSAEVSAVLDPLLLDGEVATCGMIGQPVRWIVPRGSVN